GWSDGYTDISGTYHNATVWVQNDSVSYVPIVVSGGNGTATISAAESGPWVTVQVTGDAIWAGDFGGLLRLYASGTVDDICVSGRIDSLGVGGVLSSTITAHDI